MLDLDQILRYAVQREASDVHIKVGSAPVVRIDGHLDAATTSRRTPADTERVAFAIMPKNRAEEFIETGEADFAHSVAGLGRFRVNVHRQRGSVGLVLRACSRVRSRASTRSACRLSVRRLAENTRGLVLVTGPTGSGKTTTLAAMIDHINSTMSAPHRDDRGPDRGAAHRQAVDRQPA